MFCYSVKFDQCLISEEARFTNWVVGEKHGLVSYSDGYIHIKVTGFYYVYCQVNSMKYLILNDVWVLHDIPLIFCIRISHSSLLSFCLKHVDGGRVLDTQNLPVPSLRGLNNLFDDSIGGGEPCNFFILEKVTHHSPAITCLFFLPFSANFVLFPMNYSHFTFVVFSAWHNLTCEGVFLLESQITHAVMNYYVGNVLLRQK